MRGREDTSNTHVKECVRRECLQRGPTTPETEGAGREATPGTPYSRRDGPVIAVVCHPHLLHLHQGGSDRGGIVGGGWRRNHNKHNWNGKKGGERTQ